MSDRFSSPGVLRRFASVIVLKNGKYTRQDIRRFILAGQDIAYDRSLPSGAAMHRIMNALYNLERYTRPGASMNPNEADNISELHNQARRLHHESYNMGGIKGAKEMKRRDYRERTPADEARLVTYWIPRYERVLRSMGSDPERLTYKDVSKYANALYDLWLEVRLPEVKKAALLVRQARSAARQENWRRAGVLMQQAANALR